MSLLPHERLLVFLQYIGCHPTQSFLSYANKMSETSINSSINLCREILHEAMIPQYLHPPTLAQEKEEAALFAQRYPPRRHERPNLSRQTTQNARCDFPKIIIMAVDGTHVNVTVPVADERCQYDNRHHNTSINVLVAVGMTGRFYHCDVDNTGVVHDAAAFDRSTLKDFRPRTKNGIMIADTAFKSHLNNMATPFSAAEALRDYRKARYNKIFTRKRNMVERGIGESKSRFSALLQKLRFPDTRDSAKIIQVAIAIHNWILVNENDTREEKSTSDSDTSDSSASNESDMDISLMPQRVNNRNIPTSEKILNCPSYERYFQFNR